MLKSAAVFLCILPAVLAQTTTRPEFEVASIKPNTSGERPMRIMMQPGGRLIATNVPIAFLLTFAYEIKASQITGAPEWVNNDRYDVTAKAEGNVPPDQLRLMMQAMLADRLKLSIHRETKQADVYEITPVKSGLKLTPAAAGSCQIVDREHPPAAPPAPGGPMPNFCGNIGMTRGQLNAWSIPMNRFADTLANLVGRTVIDKTGATGNYNFHLEFTPDQAIAGNMAGPGGPGDAAPPPDSASPNIFTALQEQLGIKAESAKGPVEMLIVDHVERPSEN